MDQAKALDQQESGQQEAEPANLADWNPHGYLLYYFRRIARALTRAGSVQHREIGSAMEEMPVLLALSAKGSSSPRELASFAKVAAPTMSQTVARMERQGIVRREYRSGGSQERCLVTLVV